MKKLIKLLCLLSGFLGLLAVINRLIFKRAGSAPSPAVKSRRLFYNWRHGTVSYAVTGSGRPLLLLHSLFPGSSSAEWRRAVGRLSKNYRVYTLDFLGYGCSDKPNISYSAYLCASLANDFIADIIGIPAVVAGCAHSASFAVIGCQLRHELYQGLVLVTPLKSGAPLKTPTMTESLRGKVISLPIIGTFMYIIAVSRSKLGAFLANSLATESAPLLDGALAETYRSAHCGGPNARHSYAAYVSGLFDADCVGRLSKIDKPVCIISGRENGSITTEIDLPRKDSDKGIFGMIQFREIKKAGIFPHIDRPEEFCRIFEIFIDELSCS